MYKIFDESPAKRATMEKLRLLLKVSVRFTFVLIDGLKMQEWVKEPRIFRKNMYQLLIFGKLCQK